MPFFLKKNYKNRGDALRQMAHKFDMSYTYQDDSGLINLLLDFELFRRGRRKKIFHLMTWKDKWMESDFYIFDYYYRIQQGKSSKKVRQTVFFMRSKNLALPHFLMKPETFFHKIGGVLGFKDINFEEYPDFSKQYWLKGEDEDYIRANFNDKVLKFFTVEKNWSLEGVNYFMIFYRKNKILSPNEIHDFLSKGMKLFEYFKVSS